MNGMRGILADAVVALLNPSRETLDEEERFIRRHPLLAGAVLAAIALASMRVW